MKGFLSAAILVSSFLTSYSQVIQSDSLALVALYQSTNGPSWTVNTNWLVPNSTVDTWTGISVTGNRVTQIQLPSNGLTGTLPNELGNLTEATDLILSQNNLSGTIPTSIGTMTQLTRLDLSNNALNGSLPASLGSLAYLGRLLINNNSLSGVLPSSLSSLINIVHMDLSGNNLTGAPDAVFALPLLNELHLNNNQFSGNLNNTIYGLAVNIGYLNLGFNKLTGPLPDSLFALTGLSDLYLNDNQFTEDVPVAIGRLSNLQILQLQNNKFDCLISSEMPRYMSYIDLSGNEFNHIDANLYLPNVSTFSVANNSLQFGDLESNLSYITNYSPQDSINQNQVITVAVGGSFTLTTSVSGKNNSYQWYLNGVPLDISSSYQYIVNSANTGNGGLYYCAVSDPSVPGLTLYRKTVRVYVIPCGSKISQQDSLALVAIYSSTHGANWNNRTNWLNGNVSTWFGVTTTCDRVTTLDLSNNDLVGPIPTEIGNLSLLTSLKLNDNTFSGSIPSSIGNLANLTILVLSTSKITGSLPPEIGNLTQLTYFYAENNQLSGSVPSSIENLKSLQQISLYNNQMTGSLESLCALDQIAYINFANNQFTGSLPEGITSLINLQTLYLANNQLSGTVPIRVDKLVNVQNFELRNNKFTGPISDNFSFMISLTYLALDNNMLTGSLPVDLGNGLSESGIPPDPLVQLYLQNNQFTGTIPYLGGLTALQDFQFYNNQLTGNFPGLQLCTSLQTIIGSNNNLSGTIPDIYSQLPLLTYFDFGNNRLTGALPPSLSNCTLLTDLKLNDNQLSGTIPDYSALVNLQQLSLKNNLLTGTVPNYLGSFSNLNYLNLGSNQLVGTIPTTLGADLSLNWIDLSFNQLTGAIPKELGGLSQLGILFLNNNQLTGTLPSELGNCLNLGDLVVANNQLTGKIPSSYSSFTKLFWVSLSYNSFTDSIPAAWASNAQLNYLFVDNNRFTYVPDCSALPQLIAVALNNNAFTFESIEPYYKVNSKFTFGLTYAPQDSAGAKSSTTLAFQCPFNMSAVVGGTANIYQWFKDGNAIAGATSATLNVPSAAASDAGKYTCSVTNTIVPGLTINTRPATISISPPINATINSASGALCNASLLIVTPSGLKSYQWFQDGKKIVGAQKDSLMVYYDGDYTVQYQPDPASSCKLASPAFAMTNLYSDNQPVIAGTGSPISQLSTPAVASSYQWYINDKLIAGADSASLKIWYNGSYYVVAQLANNCQYRSNTISINENSYPNLGRVGQDSDTVHLLLPAEAITIYPNPAKGMITITTGSLSANGIQVFDNAGQVLYQKDFVTPISLFQLDVSSWSNGLYLVSIVSDKKRIWQRLVKY